MSRRDGNMDAVPTKIGANSTVEVLGKSHGAFGRFFRKMHGKPTSGLGQVTSSSPGRFKLFPSRFVLPASVVADTSSKNAKSGRGRKLSWKWTEMVWCLFTFLEGGSPTTEKEQTALAQRAFTAGWSEQHEAYAGLLHEQIHSFVKLRCQEPLSRGTQKLEEIIHKIRPNNSNYEQLAQTMEELMNNATNVKPDRMSFPAEAGILDPKDFLKGDNLRAFETMHEWAPHGDEPIRPTKAVFKVMPCDRDAVYQKLLASGVACLLPVDLALRDSAGNIVSGGLFAVPHKAESDRFILDRRPQNELEHRLVMAKLPHGSLLTQIILPKDYSIRGSGDDLSNFFYLLRHNDEWLGRNCVGTPFDGKNFQEWGGIPGKKYMLSFRVIPMGDCNAVDLAQETHLQILKDCGAMQENETLAYKKIVPAKHTLEGLYIDDHLVMQILPNRRTRKSRSKFKDEELIDRSRKKYQELGLPISKKKQFTKCSDFCAWGTSVSSQSGRVGVSSEKLKGVGELIVEICQLRFVTQKLLQKAVGLLVHPAMHRRIFMSLLQEVYQFITKMKPKKEYRLPDNVREELLWMALCLPLMHANIRWPISSRIGASDASLSGGGRAACFTSEAIAKTLYRYSEHSGEHVRLDWETGALAPPSKMSEAPAELEALMGAHCWSTTEKCKFNHKQHINILELKMVKSELKELVESSNDPYRAVLLVDPRVVVGAVSKGRSSSKQLNRILRSMIGWSIVGQKSLHLVWVGTKSNPADHPSRGVSIPDPEINNPVLAAQLGFMPATERAELQNRKSNREIHKRAKNRRLGDKIAVTHESQRLDAAARCDRHPALEHWSFREIFAGKGHLTGVFRGKGLINVDAPVELIQKGTPSSAHDILCDSTFKQLCQDAKNPRQIWHFGMPCGSFSILQGLNKGTRSHNNPEGNNTLMREIKRNEILRRTVMLCSILHAHGSFFTIENPKSSYAWHMSSLVELLNCTSSNCVNLDQCQYGLKIPDENNRMGLARKATTFAGTLPGLGRLAKKCSGSHSHVQVIGGVKTKSGWQRRSTLAGAYPSALCQRYHSICLDLFRD